MICQYTIALQLISHFIPPWTGILELAFQFEESFESEYEKGTRSMQ